MNHQGTRTIETKRLILRKFTMDDVPAMFKNWAGDSEVTKFLTWPTHRNEDVSRYVIGLWLKDYEKENNYQWAIELKELGEVIGSISVVRLNDDLNEAEVGYCIGRNFWHQGITSEAFAAVIRFLFDEVGADRVCAGHDTNNPNSGKVMKKCGLSYEGTLRKSGRNNQGIVDVSIYGILRDEYETKK